MEIKGISPQSLGSLPKVSLGGGGHTSATKDFSTVLNEVQAKSKGDLHDTVQQMEQQVLGGKDVSTKDLIVFQITAQRFGMHIELVTKVAESVSGTIKKFQTGGA